MNLTQIIVYKHRDQQSFVFNTKHKVRTLVAVLSPDSLIVKYFMTCMFELFPF